MIKFALITEGITDQIVIENILTAYFDSYVNIRWLQPLRDETDENSPKSPGGWYQVFEYCQSSQFREEFALSDYVIIHIDTDVSQEKHYDVPHFDKLGNEYSPEQLIEQVINKFKGLIGEPFYNECANRIIFAIAVHSIECWLLPLYYPEDEHISGVVENCADQLRKQKTFPKKPQSYRHISNYTHEQLMKLYRANPSLKIFIEEFQRRNIIVSEVKK